MSQFAKNYLILTGLAASAGAILHVAILFGGPSWYAFFGAPEGLVAMAQAGNLRAPISCLVIASILAMFAAYAFSGAGIIRRLPFLRLGLASIASVLLFRGVLFAPLILLRPTCWPASAIVATWIPLSSSRRLFVLQWVLDMRWVHWPRLTNHSSRTRFVV